MSNYKVVISYNGINFNGYQRQSKLRSVQGEIEKVLEKIHGYSVKSFGAGRTDRGVHALGQVFNFESELKMSEEQFKRAFNSLLPDDIYVKDVEIVSRDFHSRYSCVSKEYLYLVNKGEYNPINKDFIFQYNKELNIDRMVEASRLFIGKHDFKNFCASEEKKVKDYIREISDISIKMDGDIISFKFIGDGFLRYMVRMIVGILLEIGKGKRNEDYIETRLDIQEKKRSNYKAPSCGLYLVKINY